MYNCGPSTAIAWNLWPLAAPVNLLHEARNAETCSKTCIVLNKPIILPLGVGLAPKEGLMVCPSEDCSSRFTTYLGLENLKKSECPDCGLVVKGIGMLF